MLSVERYAIDQWRRFDKVKKKTKLSKRQKLIKEQTELENVKTK